MDYGNKPTDNGHLILSPDEKKHLLTQAPQAARFIRRFMGSKEAINDLERYCLWIDDESVEDARAIAPIAQKMEEVRRFRLASPKAATRLKAEIPWRFDEARVPPSLDHAYLVPRVSSEHRPYLPTIRIPADVISGDRNFVLYDAPEWCFALLVSRLHWVWAGTVCSRLKTDFQYSNTLGWHTFPVPPLSEMDKEALKQSGRAIMRVRASHYGKSLAELYKTADMPPELLAAHKANDTLLEGLYNQGRPFNNDTERLSHLFQRYAARLHKNRTQQGKARKPEKKPMSSSVTRAPRHQSTNPEKD